MEWDYRILSAASELSASSTASPRMRAVLLRLADTYREIADLYRTQPPAGMPSSCSATDEAVHGF